jgi:hypothetical protein
MTDMTVAVTTPGLVETAEKVTNVDVEWNGVKVFLTIEDDRQLNITVVNPLGEIQLDMQAVRNCEGVSVAAARNVTLIDLKTMARINL